MGILCDLWSGSFTSTNSPDWFISNNNIAPVINMLSNGIQLSFIHCSRISWFSFFKLFTNTCHNTHSSVKSQFSLESNLSISFTIDSSSLRMSCEAPIDSCFCYHACWQLSSECTISCKWNILASYLNGWVCNCTLNCWDMECGWANNDINFGCVKFKVV